MPAAARRIVGRSWVAGTNRATAWSVLGVALAVFALGLLAVTLAPAGSHVAVWWPAAGVSVAAVAASGGTRRRSLLLAIALASLSANLVGGRSLALAGCFALANTAEAALAGCWCQRRFDLPQIGRSNFLLSVTHWSRLRLWAACRDGGAQGRPARWWAAGLAAASRHAGACGSWSLRSARQRRGAAGGRAGRWR